MLSTRTHDMRCDGVTDNLRRICVDKLTEKTDISARELIVNSHEILPFAKLANQHQRLHLINYLLTFTMFIMKIRVVSNGTFERVRSNNKYVQYVD